MNNRSAQKGFSLVELAIVMIIFGSIISIMGHALSVYTAQQQREHTTEAIEKTTGALIEAQIIFGFLPCPARLNLPEDHPDYGIADCTSVDRGIRGRDADNDGVRDPMLVGAVPIRTLEDMELDDSVIADLNTYDGWGNRLVYAVSSNLAFDNDTFPLSHGGKAEFNEQWGIIDVLDEFGVSVLEIPATAQFVIVSHGENGKGAFNNQGQRQDICTVSLTDPNDPPQQTSTFVPDPDESENCDHNDIRFLSGLRSERPGFYNDDIVRFRSLNATSLWKYTSTQTLPPANPGDPPLELDRIVSTNPGNIGVGLKTPEEKMHINGDLMADKVLADGLCDENGGTCMSAESIAGNDPNMKCSGPNQAVRIIEKNKVVCEEIFQPIILTTCPTGEAACGISNTAGLLCRPTNDPNAPCD